MLRLIIADDEKIIRDTISTFIDWQAIGIELVALCKNGLEAYDAIIDEYPDIVLTDIKMPGFTGLELIQRLTRTHKDIQFIILSGYRDFNFTVEAMRYGIRHYLVKPCNEQQIIEAIEAVKAECYQIKKKKLAERGQLHKRLLQNIVIEGIQSNIEFDRISELYEDYLTGDQENCHLCYFYYLEEQNVSECTDRITAFLQVNMPEVCYSMIYVKNTLLLILENLQPADYPTFDEFAGSLSFQEQHVDPEFKRIVYPELLDLLKVLTNKLKRFDKIYLIDGSRKTPVCNYGCCLGTVHGLTERLTGADGDEWEAVMTELSSVLSGIEDEGFLRILITDLLLVRNTGDKLSMSVKITELLEEISTCEHLRERYQYFLKTIFSREQPVNRHYKPLIEKMFCCVEEHLADPALSLKWIAEHELYMSVNYVSKQFVKQTGMRFSQYLNERRIERAKEYLRECPDETVYQIAEKIGCGNNPQYFSQLFKRYTGFSPSGYVKQYMGAGDSGEQDGYLNR